MKAEPLINHRTAISDSAFVELVLWRLPQPVPPCTHSYKYRLAYVVDGDCVVRFDNERGKGDHKHVDGVESQHVFGGPDELLADFRREVERWNDENGHF